MLYDKYLFSRMSYNPRIKLKIIILKAQWKVSNQSLNKQVQVNRNLSFEKTEIVDYKFCVFWKRLKTLSKYKFDTERILMNSQKMIIKYSEFLIQIIFNKIQSTQKQIYKASQRFYKFPIFLPSIQKLLLFAYRSKQSRIYFFVDRLIQAFCAQFVIQLNMIAEPQEEKPESKDQQSLHYQVFEHARWVNRFARKKKQSAHPSKRFNHASVLYKKYVYVYGGANTNHQKPIDGQSVYRLSLDTFEWQILSTDGDNSPGALSAFGCCLYGNCMLIFGGTNLKNEQNDELWSFNLDELKWLNIKQSGDIPEPRQSMTCAIVMNDYMFLYGGLSLENQLNFEDMYLLDLNSRVWRKLHISGDIISSRALQSGCSMQDKVYLFGGQLITYEPTYFDDLYEIKIKPSTSQAIVKSLKTVIKPPPRSSHGMLNFKNQYLLIIGGECNYSPQQDFRDEDDDDTISRNDVWLFDISRQDWLKVQPKNPSFKHRSYFSCVQEDSKIYVFGGLKNNQLLYDDVMILEIDWEKLLSRDTVGRLCPMCMHKSDTQESIPISRKQEMSFHYLQSASNMIKFPFAAIGLLIDNCIQTGATVINISVFDKDDPASMKPESATDPLASTLKSPLQTLRYILIEDNGRPWTNQQLTRIILRFEMINQLEIQIADKKTKSSILRENHKKEFGNNLKLGCLRLGKGFLYVSYYGNYVRVALFAPKKQSTNEYVYVCYYYIEDLLSGNFITSYGAQSKKHILSVCKHIIKPKALTDIHSSHQLYIFQLRQTQTKQGIYYQLNPFRGDYIYGNLYKVDFLQKIGYNVFECPDFSLKAYISLLYLKMQTKIYLQTSTDRQAKDQIQNQMFLEKIDKQKSSSFVKEIEYANEYPALCECKVVQLYYNPSMERKSSLFHAGILVYHRNRLIFRYKYELGLIFPLKFYKRKYKRTQNIVFQFFGFIELPDAIPCNFIKTDVQHSVLLEGFNTSLKLIIKDIKRKISNHEVLMPKEGVPTSVNVNGPKKIQGRPTPTPFIIRTDEKELKQHQQLRQQQLNKDNNLVALGSSQKQPPPPMEIQGKQQQPKPQIPIQNNENNDNMQIERASSEIEAENELNKDDGEEGSDDEDDKSEEDDDGDGEEDMQQDQEGVEEEQVEERGNVSEPLALTPHKQVQVESANQQQRDSQIRPEVQSAQLIRTQTEQPDPAVVENSTKSLKQLIARKIGYQ